MKAKELVNETKELCKKAIELDSHIIRNLCRIYNEKIYLDMNYGSLSNFCTGELGLCEATAQRRVAAVMLAVQVPEIADKLEAGQISQTQVNEVARFVRNEKRHADRSFTKSEISDIVNEVQGAKNAQEAQKILMAKSEITLKPVAEKHKVLPKGRQTLEIEIDDEFLELLKEVEQLDSHQGYMAKGESLKRVLKFYLSKKHPCRQALSRESEKSKAPKHRESRSRRYIAPKVRRLVWQTYGGKCAAEDGATGKRCSSSFRLQIEHIRPVAFGGTSDIENLTLLCQAHNLRSAARLGLLNRHKQEKFTFT